MTVPDGMTAESLRWVARYVPHGTPPSRLIHQWIAELEAAEQGEMEA